jgi:uncharacterized membrane protein
MASFEAWNGPIPSPEVLSKYERVIPGLAERLAQTYEREVQQRHALERASNARLDKYLDHRIRIENRGQILTFIGTVLALSVALVLAVKGLGWNAAAAIAAVFGSLGTAYTISARKLSKRERDDQGTDFYAEK